MTHVELSALFDDTILAVINRSDIIMYRCSALLSIAVLSEPDLFSKQPLGFPDAEFKTARDIFGINTGNC